MTRQTDPQIATKTTRRQTKAAPAFHQIMPKDRQKKWPEKPTIISFIEKLIGTIPSKQRLSPGKP